MTKEQERQALKKIEKIFKELGNESYVVKAFEGCTVIAEQNIDNDFFCSMKERAEAAERDAHKMGELYNELNRKCNELSKELDECKTGISANEEIAHYWHKACNETRVVYRKIYEEKCNLEEKVNEQERTIIELKAKLYDLIVKQ